MLRQEKGHIVGGDEGDFCVMLAMDSMWWLFVLLKKLNVMILCVYGNGCMVIAVCDGYAMVVQWLCCSRSVDAEEALVWYAGSANAGEIIWCVIFVLVKGRVCVR